MLQVHSGACLLIVVSRPCTLQVLMVVFEILASHHHMARWHEARIEQHEHDLEALQASFPRVAQLPIHEVLPFAIASCALSSSVPRDLGQDCSSLRAADGRLFWLI